MFNPRAWTTTEIQMAAELKKAGHNYEEIGERLSRPRGSVKSALLRNGFGCTVQQAALKRETTKKLLGHSHKQNQHGHTVTSVTVPDHVLAERDKRANELRAAGGMQGEPPFSQSALAMSLKVGESLRDKASFSGS